MDLDPVDDKEVVLRHIPGGLPWQTEAGLTSANFGLRPGEGGCSISRRSITSEKKLLELRGTGPESRIAAATVGDIRRLGLDVIADGTLDDPGHALIISAAANLRKRPVLQQLKRLFVVLPEP